VGNRRIDKRNLTERVLRHGGDSLYLYVWRRSEQAECAVRAAGGDV
jgi:hypothetical protein